MSSDLPQCFVCYSDLTHPCVTPCGHNEICATCHLRLRHLHSDKKCPMCKQENQQLIVDTFEEVKSFEEYPLWGNELGVDYTFRDDVGMFFPVGYYNSKILPLFGHYCGVCNEYDGVTPETNMHDEADKKRNPQGNNRKNNKGPITPMRGLQDHLRNKHRLTLCQLCAEFKRDFVSQLPRFSPYQLKNHHAKGDGADSGFNGHPVCEFCRPKRFYDLTQLHMHLQKDHYKCHVCEKKGLANQYFRDYHAMEKHFERQHFLCKDVQCLAARFMVFDNEIDLRAHELSVHGGTDSGSTKIQLEFRVRREGYDGAGYENQTAPSEDDFQYGVDGQAFVPEDIPNHDAPNEETSHPVHYQRTNELRAQAAEIRANQDISESQEEAFPSLGGANNGMRMGWTSSGSLQKITKKQVATTADNFPSLPAAAGGKHDYNSVGAKLRAGGVSGSRQFSAMRSAAMGSAPAPSSNNWGNQPAVSQAAPSGSANFVTSAAMGPAMNRQADLASNNFPALGGATKTRASYPVNSHSGNRASQAPPMSSNNFPSLGGASRQQPQVPRRQQQSPSLSNASHFPPPPTATTKQNSVRAKLLGNRKSAPTNSMNNFPSMSGQKSLHQGQATVEDMKASLGVMKYKDLKSLTRQFASDGLVPQAYVDHAAALFDDGYGDADFWNFVPPLLLSCPNQSSAATALRYMEDLGASISARAVPAPSISWSASPSLEASSNRSAVAKPYGAAIGRAPRAAVRPIGTATQAAHNRSGTNGMQSKQQSKWSGSTGGASTAVMAKSSPMSVAVAAANQGPQTGTATKFMAKEKKQQAQHQQSNGGSGKDKNKNKNKKKEKDELRALAFGK
mmetsp:Transcript_30448/g.50252  ORF Transcript_30448/g.50252 Transcript_30448/m.50252 type:complete len:845 (-) Transcript_30448:191-2725(-)|eukprot:CAMPEP_0119005574 /NCGR_PEP_ID=MMETSP1176-20130426/1805_1 /TAXON_ID=265551 /ORGANISM="Synedropsis recta cf, Strain CCMP1620" /LENGTH=844 /DNA_ID=CAMNT_0006957405 /DNA_START=157 /DNA_END=2691 /DNA_ORIENTATION=+